MGAEALRWRGWRERGREVAGAFLRLLWGVGLVLGLLMGGLGAGRAQDLATATVQGTLRDARGLALAGAGVRLISQMTGFSQFARTDAHGRFGFLRISPGEYLGAVQLPLSPYWTGQAIVTLNGGEVTGLTLQVREGERGLVVSAVADADGQGTGGEEAFEGRRSPVKAGTGKQSDNLEAAGQLPVPERAWEVVTEASSATRDTTLADNGAAQDAVEGEENASAREARETGAAATGLSVDGLPVAEDGARVDGLSAEQGFRAGPRGAATGGPRAGSALAQGAIGRLAVRTERYSAQGGGAAGATLAVATRGVEGGSRSGWHGNGFFQARESAWAASNPFAVVTTMRAGAAEQDHFQPADSALTFGGALGRAVRVPGLPRAWRVGVFGAGEVFERRQGVFSSPENPEFFLLSSTQRALLANRGVRTAEVSAALEHLSELGGLLTLTGRRGLGFGRVDLQPGHRDQLSVAVQALRSKAPVLAGQWAEGVTDRASASVGTNDIAVSAVTMGWAHTFGPRWVNQVRAQVARDQEAESPGADTGGAGLPAWGPDGLPPQVTIGPEGFSFGTPASLGRVAYPDERRVEVAESSTWRFGRHVLTVGGDWSRLDDAVLGTTNREGTFLYDSGSTGGRAGGLVDWITDYTFNVQAYPNGGCPSITATEHFFCFRSYAQSFTRSETEFVTHEVAGFAEDAIRLGPRLRLTLGARWEYQLLPFPLLPNAALDRDLAQAGLGGGPGPYGVTASFPEDRNNVGPRVTLRWTPGARGHGWLTIDAGYGMFFGRLPGATLDAALTATGMANSTTSVRITPTVETACPQVANQGFGYPCSFLYAPAGVAAVAQTGAATVFARRFRLPVVQRGSFAVEREMGKHVQVRGEYATAWAMQLPETTDLNIAPSTSAVSYVLEGADGQKGLWAGQSFRVPLYTERRTTKFGPVTAIESNANATYHSGTAETVLRSWHGWGARAGYTFSKAIDFGPQTGPTPRQDGQFDPFTNGYDKARSSLDRPWQAAGAVSYRSSWNGRNEWGKQLLGGWGFAVLGRAGSGAPYSYGVFGGTRLSGGHESINGSGGATYLPTVGRNTLRLPMRSKLDVRASREVKLGSKRGREWRVQVRADVFNALNTVSLSRVETRAFLTGDADSEGGMTPLVFQSAAAVANEGVSTPAFGTALSSTTGLSRERTMELGAKLQF